MRSSLVLGIAAALAASAHGAYVENYNSAAVGANAGQLPGFYGTAGSSWATVNANGGVAGTQGIGPGDQAFNWTAHVFNWGSMSVGDKVTIGMDFQASSTGTFDDDRIGWAFNAASSTSSNNHFGVQLDTNTSSSANVGVVGYWKVGGTTYYKPIINFANVGLTPTASAWYQARASYTKLANGFAGIDVTLQALDSSGNLIGSVYTGSLADSSASPNGSPSTYFTGDLSPMYKNFTSQAGNADNAYYSGVIPVPEPTALSVLMLGGLLLGRRRSA